MEHCDVLIVGGGPAGSSCAGQLHRAGLRVIVIDRAKFPRDKVCAGWVTPEVMQTLSINMDDYRDGRVLQPITGFLTGSIGGDCIRTDYEETVSYGIRRCEFDTYLLERCGAETAQATPLKSLERSGGEWIVNDSFRAPLVVGAGGHFCPVSRHMGNSDPQQVGVVMAQEVEFEMTEEQAQNCAAEGNVPELYFCPDLQGYGWCFRKGNFLNIGLGRESEDHLSTHVAEFSKYLIDRRRIPADSPTRYKGHAYRLYGKAPRKIIDDHILLIGDAAGLAYPQSGEGIRPAVESGLLAAEVILSASPNYRADDLAEYHRRLTERFGDEHQLEGGIPLPAGLRRFVAAKLLATGWFTRRVLLDRWFLHRHVQPLETSASATE